MTSADRHPLRALARIASTLLALTLTAAAQSPDPASGAPETGWILHDAIAAQAGDEIVTMRELDQAIRDAVRSRFGDQPLSNRAELEQMSREALQAMVDMLLESQAGEDMGVDPEKISLFVDRMVATERRGLGASQYVEQLLAGGQQGLTVEEARVRQLYRQLWLGSTLGWDNGWARRTRDRHIRPGELKAMYREGRELLWPDRVRLRVLAVPVGPDGPEPAHRRLEEALARIEKGEDFAELAAELGMETPDGRGLLGWMQVPTLVPGLKEFAAEAELGDLSPILPMPPGDRPVRFVLARLEDREEQTPPAYDGRDVQQTLRRLYTRRRDDRILTMERARLHRAAYAWLHPGLRGPQGGAGGAESPPR